MPKINVYLPDDLASAVRKAGIPVSAVCQRALADAVAAVDGGLGTSEPPGDPKEETSSERLRSRLTQRVQRVIELATEAAGGDPLAVSSVELTEALVRQGNNLALAVLRSLDIEPDDLRTELRATESTNRRSDGERLAATLDEVCERAAEAAISLENNYIGCEHLLLGLLDGPDADPAASTLRTLGLDVEKCRDAVRAALGGISYAQGNLSFTGLSAPIRSVLEEIRQRLGRLEQPGN